MSKLIQRSYVIVKLEQFEVIEIRNNNIFRIASDVYNLNLLLSLWLTNRALKLFTLQVSSSFGGNKYNGKWLLMTRGDGTLFSVSIEHMSIIPGGKFSGDVKNEPLEYRRK